MALAALAVTIFPTAFSITLAILCDWNWYKVAYGVLFEPPVDGITPPIPDDSDYFSVLGSQTVFVGIHLVILINELRVCVTDFLRRLRRAMFDPIE